MWDVIKEFLCNRPLCDLGLHLTWHVATHCSVEMAKGTVRVLALLSFSERGVTYGHMFKWIGVVHQQEQRLGTITWVHLNCGTLDDPCCKEGVCRGGDPEPLCPLMSHSVSRSVSPVCLSFCPAVCNPRPDFFLVGVAVGRSLVAVGMQRRDGGQGAGQIKVWRCMFCWIVCCLTTFEWVEGKNFILGPVSYTHLRAHET